MAEDSGFLLPLAVVSKVFKAAISKFGRQESFVVEEQSSVFEFDCLIDCHFPASQSSHQFPSLLTEHPATILEVEVAFIAKQHQQADRKTRQVLEELGGK